MLPRLRNLLHSIKFRLTALNIIVFGLLQMMSFALILTLRSRESLQTFDDWLVADATRMSEEVAAQPSALGTGRTPEISPFHLKGCYFQIRTPDGATLVKSSNLARTELPFGPVEQRARALHQVFGTLDAAAVTPTPGLSGDVRVLTIYYDRGPANPFYLQLGARLDRITLQIRSFQRLLQLLFPISLIWVGVASWYLARRSMSPIDRITAAARKMTVDHLEQRLGFNLPHGDLASLVASLNEMLERIEKSVRSQERFAADVSHELKTPISVLLGEAQVLARKDRSPEEYQRFLGSVEAEMHRLARTVDSLLLLARANAGHPVPLSEVSLNDVIDEAVRRCQPVAEHWNTTLLPRLLLPEGDEPEPLVRGDEELLCAMVTNLVLNAIRHSPLGGQIDIDLAVEHDSARIAVRDTGPGIPPELIGQIFHPLSGDSRERGLVRGTGLGLMIVRSVAELHGGSIKAANLPVKGCEFSVRLPLALTRPPAHAV